MPLLSQPKTMVTDRGTARTVGKDGQNIVLLLFSLVLLVGGLGGRLAYLQLIEGDRNRQLAENNRIRLVAKAPERGRIFDRKNQILATSRLAHVIYLWPIAQAKGKWPDTILKLSALTGISDKEILKKLEQEGYTSPNLVRVSGAIGAKLVTLLAEHSADLPGVRVEPLSVRYYPNGDIAAHLMGYTGELTAEELESLKKKGYRLGDVVGKAGVEFSFESKLRGTWGGDQVEVDAAGKVLRILGRKSPQPGNPIHLTIDLDLQKAAETILGDLQGGIVAMNPQNGEILAMSSRPTFDPNVFSSRISEAMWKRLQAKDHPFVNRVLRAYPPASTFKIVTTAAGIEAGGFSASDTLATFPYLEVGGIQFWDHNNAGFGVIGFAEAIAYSSDTFFYQVGRRVGVDKMVEWTRKFGFGKHTGIELVDEEDPGLVPDPAWKVKTLKEPWYEGNTINMSIGQGDVLANLLQVLVMTSVPANGGYLVQPHLLLDDAESKSWRKSLNLHPNTIAVIREGLRGVLTFGTGQALNSSTIAIAGKSGTAEDPPRPSHTWFVAYAPVENPEIAVCVFGENSGGGGGSIAGPRALKLIEAYFDIKRKHAQSAVPKSF